MVKDQETTEEVCKVSGTNPAIKVVYIKDAEQRNGRTSFYKNHSTGFFS